MPTGRRHLAATRGVALATALLAAGAVTAPAGSPVGRGAPAVSTTKVARAAYSAQPGEGTTSDGPVAPGTATAVAPGTATAVAPRTADLSPADRPNIVVIMADDMRADEVRHMPNVRRLVGDEGVEFVNSFSPHPLCCPARASFVTGQYTHNHGVWSNRPPYGFSALDDSRTVATALDDVGYNTAFLGKYLNGYGAEPAPDGSPSSTYVPPGWDEWRGAVTGPPGWDHPDAGGTYRYYDTTLNVDGVLQGHPGVYQTRMLGLQAADLVAELSRSPRPFFLWSSFVAPHIGSPREDDDPEPVTRGDGLTTKFGTPARPRWVRGLFDRAVTEAPGARGEKDVSDKPFYIRALPQANAAERAAMLALARQRAEALYVLDQEVGRTVAALEAAGELDDTILVFTSDNGYFIGEHRVRQGKTLPYEPSLRVPTLVRGPGIPAGQRRTDPVTTIDLAPTFLEAAGAQPDPLMDGVSVLDVAREGDEGWSRAVLTQTGPMPDTNEAAAEGADFLDDDDGGLSLGRFTQGVRTPRYLYVEHASRERELYDLRSDGDQLRSIVDDPAAQPVANVLARVLDRLRTCAGPSCAAPLPRLLREP